MPDHRSPWRRAFGLPLIAAIVAFTVAGGLVLALVPGNLAKGVATFLLAVSLTIVVAGVFLAIGYGEDDERAGRRG